MLFNTTGFSRVLFQLRATNRVALRLRHHRLPPHGVSTSHYEPSRAASPTPPTSAAWCFNFALRNLRHHRLPPHGVSTSHYEPICAASPTPPASAAWCFNFALRFALDLRHPASAAWCFNFALRSLPFTLFP